ncbi:HNH endonuclease [Streptomyces sp. NBC_01527]|uniref:HNH endonuclease n=1 Tax=Streptomyces sp. NBC_01527 TaxID=2903894 RepID=UPI003869BCFC
MSADRSVCTECLGPKPRPDRNTCGAPLCVESARLLTAHRKAREAARAFRGAPICERCQMPHGRPPTSRYCPKCADDIAELRTADERRARERKRAEDAAKPCQGPNCANPVGLSEGKAPARSYCSPTCAKAAEYIRRKARSKPDPVPCRRCGTPHVPKFRDGVCRGCQTKQRTKARRVTLQRAVREAHGATHCHHCMTSLGGEAIIDHLIPVSRGGVSTVANMRFVCQHCNASKKDQLLSEWSPA